MKNLINRDTILSVILMVILLITLTIQVISCTNTPAYADEEPTMPVGADRFNMISVDEIKSGINYMIIYVVTDIETANQYLIVKSPTGIGVCPME